MRTCFVPFCDVKNKDQPNRTMFLVPKEQTLFAQWVKALPKVRTLRSTDRVCHLHFRPDDVVFTFDHCINGRIYKINRDRPKLNPDALPCLEMTTEQELLTYKVKTRLPNHNSPKELHFSDNSITEQITDLITAEEHLENESKLITDVNMEDDVENFASQEQTTNESENQIIDFVLVESNDESAEMPVTNNDNNSQHLAKTQTIHLFELLYNNAYDVLMPSTLWGIHRSPNLSKMCFSNMDLTTLQVTKMVCIYIEGWVELIFNGNVIQTLSLTQEITDMKSLSSILNKFDMWRLCFGYLSNANCEIFVEPSDGNCWSTDDNEQIFLCKICLEN